MFCQLRLLGHLCSTPVVGPFEWPQWVQLLLTDPLKRRMCHPWVVEVGPNFVLNLRNNFFGCPPHVDGIPVLYKLDTLYS